jgi:thioredoxin-related protein
MLDFTGWSCANCRKMENEVWSKPEILERLKNDFVLVSLYVDDRTELLSKNKLPMNAVIRFVQLATKTLILKFPPLI